MDIYIDITVHTENTFLNLVYFLFFIKFRNVNYYVPIVNKFYGLGYIEDGLLWFFIKLGMNT